MQHLENKMRQEKNGSPHERIELRSGKQGPESRQSRKNSTGNGGDCRQRTMMGSKLGIDDVRSKPNISL